MLKDLPLRTLIINIRKCRDDEVLKLCVGFPELRVLEVSKDERSRTTVARPCEPFLQLAKLAHLEVVRVSLDGVRNIRDHKFSFPMLSVRRCSCSSRSSLAGRVPCKLRRTGMGRPPGARGGDAEAVHSAHLRPGHAARRSWLSWEAERPQLAWVLCHLAR